MEPGSQHCWVLVAVLFAASGHAAEGPIQLKIVGGLGAVSQYRTIRETVLDT